MRKKTLHEIVFTNIQKVLKAKGIAQRELARSLKRDKVTVNRWINGNRGITLNNLEAIAKAIKVKPEKLISSELKVIHKIVIK